MMKVDSKQIRKSIRFTSIIKSDKGPFISNE